MAAVTNQNNPSPNSNLTAEGQFRGIMAYPEIDLFYELLMDRVQMVLSQFFLEKPFTVFITALPRNHEEGTILRTPRLGDYTLIYAGISRQRDLLGAPENPSPKLWECWDKLSATRKSKMRSNDPSMASPAMGELNTESAPITSQLIDRYQNKQFKLEVIEGLGMGTLTNYFATRDAPYQEEEFQVLSAYFDIGQYRYLSVPLIQFSEFDGVVHIIYHQEEHSRFKDEKSGEFKKRAVGNVIKAISREYEGIILDWQVVGGNLTKRSALKDAINLAHASERARENVILSELDYGGYYEKHSAYIESRIDLNDKIPDIILAQYHRIATMQILIDSYTHNISAHSLVALEGWYKQRALYHGSRKTRLDVLDLPLIREERSFDHETHQFVRFMLDKGAFWTGLTRDYSFGGKTNSLYSVLWHDFVNNPLYLGTIAYTEGILKLNINITFLGEAKKSGEDVILRKEVLADGTWASIDLRKFRETIQEGKDMQTENEHDYLSGFITKGPSFNDLSSRLRECKSYFPGGVVGRHAFFTILENEIRNVKHYSIEVLESMQDDGLTLNISIEKENYHRGSSEVPEYYKIGVWLKHPVDVTHKMITDRLGWLEGKIINENHNPRLGGAFQDKVCAAMLFNNSFVSVQDRETERDKRFYPWIKVGFSKEDQGEPARFIEDWEISVRRYYWEKAATESERNAFRRSRAYFDQNFEKESGYYKKFFHIWRGDDLHDYTGDEAPDASWENLARFKFVQTPQDKYRQNFRPLREKGIVRILDLPVNNVGEAYSAWLKKWLQKGEQESSGLCFEFAENEQVNAQLVWDGTSTRFIGREKGALASTPAIRIPMVHGGRKLPSNEENEACRYRSHGIFLQHFCRSKSMATGFMNESEAAELVETFATQICIFDNRVQNWVETMSRSKMRMLGCEIFEEKRRLFNDIKKRKGGFFNYHFVVVHLSFIERFLDEKKEKYTEETIDKFIDNEILQGANPPDNFIVVITSGRGRRQWQSTLESGSNASKNYLAFVTFRPVESLVGAVEQAMSRADDFDMKYLLTKILIGS